MGLLAGLVQATTVYTLTYARLAECDISLWALVLGCLSIFARHHTLPDHVPRRYESRFMFFLLLGSYTRIKDLFSGCDRVIAVRDLPCMAARLEGTAGCFATGPDSWYFCAFRWPGQSQLRRFIRKPWICGGCTPSAGSTAR